MSQPATPARLAGWLRENWMTLSVVLALAVAWILLRSSPTEIESIEGLVEGLARGEPTIVTFYSNA